MLLSRNKSRQLERRGTEQVSLRHSTIFNTRRPVQDFAFIILMPVLSRIFLVLSFLLLASQLVASLKGDVKFTSSDGGRRLVRFAFKNGGRASGSMTITTVC